MTTTYYKLTIKGMKGCAYVSYKNDVLLMAINELKSTGCEPVGGFVIPLIKGHLAHFHCEEIKPKTVSAKAALFVLMFKEHRNVVYTPSKIELSNLRHVTMSEQLLKVYFAAKDYPLAGPKTISDYIRNYNAVRDLAANGPAVKAGFPDYFDSGYEKMLSPEKLSAYRLHLVALGWRKIDGVWVRNHLSSKMHED